HLERPRQEPLNFGLRFLGVVQRHVFVIVCEEILVLHEPPKMLDPVGRSLMSPAFLLELSGRFTVILCSAAITGEKNEHRVCHGDSGVNIKQPGGVGAQTKSAVRRRVAEELAGPLHGLGINSYVAKSHQLLRPSSVVEHPLHIHVQGHFTTKSGAARGSTCREPCSSITPYLPRLRRGLAFDWSQSVAACCAISARPVRTGSRSIGSSSSRLRVTAQAVS